MPTPHRHHPSATARIAGHPIHTMIVPFPLVCYCLTVLTDAMFLKTQQIQWSNFSAWLLAVGVVTAILAAIAGSIDFWANRGIREQKSAWPHALGNSLALLLAIWNLMVHGHDAYTSVYPTGMILSVITALLVIVTAWLGGELVYRRGVGVSD
jgi:uncharacterized membrane protein